MVFSSLIFTFIFLPVIVILYFLAKEEYRNYLLLIASLVFYAYGEPRFVFVMLVSIVVNYAFAVGMDVMQNRGRPVYKRIASGSGPVRKAIMEQSPASPSDCDP